MNEEVCELTYKLKEEIEHSEIFLNLKKYEKEIENDEELQLLSYKKDMLIVKLEDTLKYKDKNSIEVLNINKEINEILTKMNSYEIVKKYNYYLNEYNKILDKINREIFDI